MATALLDELRKTCGDDHVRAATPGDAVAGVVPEWVAAPASTGEVSEVLRSAATHGARTVVRGAGTKLDWGRPPEGVEILLDTARLTGVLEHAAGDLVVRVSAGTPVQAVQEHVRRAGQRLALDAPVEGATVGGTLATATSGPSRLLYGTARDLLIGVTVVRADGVVARSGGTVVKNVAGYDLGKLYTGSYGTLGVVTEAVFRLHPLPAATAVVTATADDGPHAWRLVRAVLHSQVVPTALEIDLATPDAPPTVAVLLEGVPAGVTARAAATAALMGDAAGSDPDPPSWWSRYPAGRGDVLIKISHPVSRLADVLATVRRHAHGTGLSPAVRGSAGAGVLYAGMPADADPDAVGALLRGLRAEVTGDGAAVVLHAPPAVRDAVDVWGAVPGLDLMRRVKERFDPDRRLAPGRFVGGI